MNISVDFVTGYFRCSVRWRTVTTELKVLHAPTEISPESNSVKTVYKSPSDEIIHRGPLCRVYARTQKDHIRTLKIL